MNDLQRFRLSVLMQYAEWERENRPPEEKRQHILEWAVRELQRLYALERDSGGRQ